MGDSIFTYIICTRNRPELLSGLLEKLSQNTSTVENRFEILVIDSGSKPQAKSRNREISDFYNCEYFYSEVPGLSIARNKGIEIARSDYVYFLDDDVLVEPDHAQQVSEVIYTMSPDLFGGPVKTLFPDSTPEWYDKTWNERKFKDKSGYGASRLSGGNFGGRVEVFKLLGGFDIKLGMSGSKVLVGEERDLIERYLAIKDSSRIYYALNLLVWEPLPKSKTKFLYRLRREFAIGSALIRKQASPYRNISFLAWFQGIPRALIKVRQVNADGVGILWIRRILRLSFLIGTIKRNLLFTIENKRETRKSLVVLYYEHAARELPTLLALQKSLLETGRYEIAILNLASDRWLTKLISPNLVVIPYYYDSSSDALADLIKSSSKAQFISLSWEQIFYPAKVQSKIPKNPPGNLHIATWTKTWYGVLRNHGVNEEQLTHLGHPVWSNLARGSRPHERCDHNTLLFVENSSLAFSKMSKLLALTSTPKEIKDNFQELLKTNLVALHRFQLKNGAAVMIRVRPSTRISDFQEVARKFVPDNNFTYSQSKSLRVDLEHADFVLTEMSTTCLEASLMGKPVGLLHSRLIPDEFKYDWFHFFPILKNEQEIQLFAQFEQPDNNQVTKWAQDEGAINTNYYRDFITLSDGLLADRTEKSLLSIKMFAVLRSVLYGWQELMAIKFIRSFVFKFFIRKFSINSHEKDFPRPKTWKEFENYEF